MCEYITVVSNIAFHWHCTWIFSGAKLTFGYFEGLLPKKNWVPIVIWLTCVHYYTMYVLYYGDACVMGLWYTSQVYVAATCHVGPILCISDTVTCSNDKITHSSPIGTCSSCKITCSTHLEAWTRDVKRQQSHMQCTQKHVTGTCGSHVQYTPRRPGMWSSDKLSVRFFCRE